MKIEAYGMVDEKGILKIRNRKDFDQALKGLSGKECVITVAKYRKTRSSMQNRYYWAVVVDMIRNRLVDLGHDVTREDVHDFLKGRFHFKEFVDEKSGEVILVGQSTADLTTSEFMEYLEKIKQFASEILDVVIPDPNTQAAMFAE